MKPRSGRTPKSAISIIGTLAQHGPMCPQEISNELGMAPRTVSFALRKLLKGEILRRIPNLSDMRRPMYHVNVEKARELLDRYNVRPSPLAWTQKA
jgi:DNA-binding MarR family transcriptional regulator